MINHPYSRRKALWIGISQVWAKKKVLVVGWLFYVCVVFAQIAFSLNASYVKKKVFIFSHTSHVLATFAKTRDTMIIVSNIIKVFLNMRTLSLTPACLVSQYHPSSFSSRAQIKSITASLLSILWAFLMVAPTTSSAEALNGDSHLTGRSKIFEEKGNYYNVY